MTGSHIAAILRLALGALLVALAIPVGASAKTCSSSYTHAVIGGTQKCLRAGEFCAKADKAQYPAYGFVCKIVSGAYRLEAGAQPTAGGSPDPTRCNGDVINFAALTSVTGTTCITAERIAGAYVELYLADGKSPTSLADFRCSTGAHNPNSESDHLRVTCSRTSATVRFVVGP